MTSHQHVLTGTLIEAGVGKSGNGRKYCITWKLHKFEGLAIHVHVKVIVNLQNPGRRDTP